MANRIAGNILAYDKATGAGTAADPWIPQGRTAPATTATLANVSSSATNVTVVAANANRLGLLLYNDSSAVLYLKFGATASASSFTVALAAGAYWEMPQPVYVGIVDGIWASANGAARVTELT